MYDYPDYLSILNRSTPAQISIFTYEMKYVARRLAVVESNGKEKEYSDDEFFSLNGPLVILGEPGSGKSEIVRQLSLLPTNIVYSASSVITFPLLPSAPSGTRVVIDGLDEITAYTPGTPIAQVLSKITTEDISTFVFTCRAVDWQHHANSSMIFDRWRKSPVVGKLLPLNNIEIIAFANAYGCGQSGEEFIESAAEHDALDLLRNPQTLTMLLQVVLKVGWPATRTELYKEACKLLVEEENIIHQSINRNRPTSELLLEVTGFINTQLLLANKNSVNLALGSITDSMRSSEIQSSEYGESVVRAALSSKAFRIVGPDTVEPCHRTIAEFTAAKWLSAQLNKHISLRRLEGLLYGSNYIVPPALRGLHAWIATIGPHEIRNALLARDPYGVFRYGDPHELSTDQSKSLLMALRELSDVDPYFRSEDWHATFGKGLAKPQLKDDILELLRNPQTPYQLSHLILESIQGEAFANLIADDLLNIVKSQSSTPIERFAALEALKGCAKEPDWHRVVQVLHLYKDIESLRVALRIIEMKPNLFSGSTIANILIGVSVASKNGVRYSGIAYGIQKKLDSTQLNEALTVLSKIDSVNDPDSDEDDANDHVFPFLQELFEHENPPKPKTLWRILHKLRRYSYYNRSDFNEIAATYLEKATAYRQLVQDFAFVSTKDNHHMLYYYLREACPGLWLREIDVLKLLKKVVQNKNKFQDWVERWKWLVWYLRNNSEFNGSAYEYALKQVHNNPELLPILLDLEKPIKSNYEVQEEKARHKWEEKQEKLSKTRHESYEKVAAGLLNGKQLDAISNIAQAFLGRFSDIKGESPEERVLNLVGNKVAAIALSSISVAVNNGNIPTAKQIVEIRAKEKKEYFISQILTAHMHMMGENLDNTPLEVLKSGLASCHWGLHFHNDKITPPLQARLEQIIFKDSQIKENFIKDTIEPYLESNAEIISGLFRITEEEIFSDIAGKLADEWLAKYSQFSTYSLKELIKAAIKYNAPSNLVELINEKIKTSAWSNEEQRGIWFGSLFILNFENSAEILRSFALEDGTRFWSFKNIVSLSKKTDFLTARQNHFIISLFAKSNPADASPPSGSVGTDHPWEASQFIFDRIKAMSTNLSDESTKLLKELTVNKDLDGYLNQVKHSFNQHLRMKSDGIMRSVSLAGVRSVILSGEPVNHLDLQYLLLDQLEYLQRRLKDSPTNDYITFWKGDTPHDEEYCRDRIVASLNPYLERFKVRAHTEGTMPNNRRCDFLNTFDTFDLPVEVKGQWHREIWKAACDQLETYSKEYRANGYGIYLVLWFGKIKSRSPKNPRNYFRKAPTSLEEMSGLLKKNYQGTLSSKTKLFVLDLSKPPSGN